MKLATAQLGAFLRDPGGCRAVLLYGDDAGLVRDRAEALVTVVAGSLDDPFRVVELSRDELDRLPDEALSQSLTGGRVVVRVRETPDTQAFGKLLKLVLQGRGTTLTVLEGAGLPSRSTIRTVLEAAPDGAAIGCYPAEGRELEASIRDILRGAGVSVDAEALRWLSDHLGADRASTRAELGKLVLFVGPAGRIDLESAMACVGDLAGLSLDDAMFAATAGDVTTADRALELALAEGSSPIQVVRMTMRHLERLHRARLAMDSTGIGAADAVKAVRPPLFFRRVGLFSRALGLWSSATLMATMAALAEAERNCKRTGYDDLTLCKREVITIARRAGQMGMGARR